MLGPIKSFSENTVRLIAILATLALTAAPLAAQAHVTVWPRQSEQGAREKYAVRMPNEKKADTVRLEGQFPAELKVSSFQQTPGWKIEVKRDTVGAIVGAVWTGVLPPDQFAEFGVTATNPKAPSLTWKFIQTYADGLKVEWTGEPGSASPAPKVELRPAAAAP